MYFTALTMSYKMDVRASAINSVVCHYEHLMQILDIIQNDRATPTDAASTARGLLNQLQMSKTYFRYAVAYRLFAITDAFATAVQRSTINIAEVIRRKRERGVERTALISRSV